MTLKPFLSLNKVKEWYMDNKPEEVLLAKLGDGTLPVRVIDNGFELNVYLSFEDEDDAGLIELEVEMIDDLRFKAIIHESDDVLDRSRVRIFTQPEKDAWIEWK
jgi:hypothetical protein